MLQWIDSLSWRFQALPLLDVSSKDPRSERAAFQIRVIQHENMLAWWKYIFLNRFETPPVRDFPWGNHYVDVDWLKDKSLFNGTTKCFSSQEKSAFRIASESTILAWWREGKYSIYCICFLATELSNTYHNIEIWINFSIRMLIKTSIDFFMPDEEGDPEIL